MSVTRGDIARQGEELARAYLVDRGYGIRERNYRFGRGEIDLIAEDGETLVFVEVKTRRSNVYGPPECALTPAKQRQLRRVAEGYMYTRKLSDIPCRFDVITVEFEENEPRIRHIVHAFTFYDR